MTEPQWAAGSRDHSEGDQVDELVRTLQGDIEAISDFQDEVWALIAKLRGPRAGMGKGQAEAFVLRLMAVTRISVKSDAAAIKLVVRAWLEAAQRPAGHESADAPKDYSRLWAPPQGSGFVRNPAGVWLHRVQGLSRVRREEAKLSINAEMARITRAPEFPREHVGALVLHVFETPLVPSDGYRRMSDKLAAIHWTLAYMEGGQRPDWEPCILWHGSKSLQETGWSGTHRLLHPEVFWIPYKSLVCNNSSGFKGTTGWRGALRSPCGLKT